MGSVFLSLFLLLLLWPCLLPVLFPSLVLSSSLPSAFLPQPPAHALFPELSSSLLSLFLPLLHVLVPSVSLPLFSQNHPKTLKKKQEEQMLEQPKQQHQTLQKECEVFCLPFV